MMRSWYLLLCGGLLPLWMATAAPQLDGMRHFCYADERDLNIAVFLGLTKQIETSSKLKCSRTVSETTSYYYTTVVKYVLDGFNARPDILPNISLGFVIFDTCSLHLANLADMMYILPTTDEPEPPKTNTSYYTCENGWKRFKVVGGVGPSFSTAAVMMGGLSTIFKMPLLFTFASSDELSDKTRYAYTMRVVPPDRFQAEALTDILLYFGWTYASLIYYEGAYGESGAKQVEKNAKLKGICLAFRFMIPSDYSDDDLLEIARKMDIYRDARVIIAFIGSSTIRNLARAIKRANIDSTHYIWLGSDAVGYPEANDLELGPLFDGGITVSFPAKIDEDFHKYVRTQVTMETDPGDPFLRNTYELYHGCTWDEKVGNNSCYRYASQPLDIEKSSSGESKYIDGLDVFVYGLQALISENCPEAFTDKRVLDTCITGDRLYSYLLEVEFDGLSGPIRFDDKGDFLGSYLFEQYQFGIGDVDVGSWDKASKQHLHIKRENLRWLDRNKNMSDRSPIFPESVCSQPCEPKEYSIQKELPCCWECRRCRDNEILIENKTGCGTCDILKWPDDETQTYCEEIEPERLSWGSPLVISLLAVTCLGLAVCFTMGFIFIKNSKHPLIKASSRQLMAIILVGIIIAYLTVITLLLPPSTLTCYLSRFGFNLSVGFIYAPLMVKTNRIYRIFTAGKRGTKRPMMVGTRSQLILVTIFLLMQLGLCVVSIILAPAVAVLRQQVPTEKYVESLCSLPLSGLVPPLSINLLFIVVCALYGFLTRKLPENFNESWYIFISVATTTFLWLVFLPAYFTAFYAVHQVVLLACCLIFNGTVTLLCLYCPKVYCVYFVDDDQVQLQTAGTIGTAIGTAASNAADN